MNVYSLFAQDSWRVTPTLTLNGGLRWDVQMPFSPVNDIMSSVDATPTSAASRASAPTALQCNFFEPGATRRQVADVRRSSPSGTRGTTPTGTTSRRTRRRRGGRTCRAAFCGRCSAIPTGDAARRLLGGLRPAGHGRVHRPLRANPGSTLSLTRERQRPAIWSRPVETWPVSCSQTEPALDTAPFPSTAGLPDRRSGRTAPTASTSSRPDIQIAYGALLDGRLPAVDHRATWRSTSATSARAA